MNVERLGLLVILLAAVVMVYRIDAPATYVYDECYQAFTAGRYVRGDREAWKGETTRAAAARFATDDMNRFSAYEWTHPPGAKLIMAAFIARAGFGPTAFRLGSAIFGVLTLMMSWLLARRLRGPGFALVVVALLACDGMVLVMSRVAMNDIYVTGSLITAVYLLYRYWTADAGGLRWLVAAGAMFGVALSMKWSAGPPLVAAALAVAGQIVIDARRGQRTGRAAWSSAGAWVVAFVAAPACVYLASYLPYFWIGNGWQDLVHLQRAMWSAHHALAVTAPQSSRWWEWPWMIRPVLFYLRQSPEGMRVVYAMGNPLLWWAFVPSLAWVAVRFARHRSLGDALILGGFASAWLPWAFVDRVTFIQYLLPAVPFGALAVATALDDLARAWKRGGRILRIGYCAACFACFVGFHPLWTAGLATRAQLDMLMGNSARRASE